MGLLTKKKLKPTVVTKRSTSTPPPIDNKKYPSVGRMKPRGYAGKT
jgi:hypothetical protein